MAKLKKTTKKTEEPKAVESKQPKGEIDLKGFEGVIKGKGGYLVVVAGKIERVCIGSDAFHEAVKAYKVLVLGR